MPAPRKIYSAIGATQQSARDTILALGPSLLGSPAPLLNQVPTWNGSAYVPANASSGGGGGVQFIFTPSAPAPDPSKNLYNDWAALMTAIGALPEGANPQIVGTESFTIPTAGMPVNGWYMNSATLGSRTYDTGVVKFTLEDGAKLDSLLGWTDGIVLRFQPSVITDTINFVTFAAKHPSEPWILFVGKGAGYESVGTVAPITGPGTGQFIVVAASEATLRAGPPPPTALVNITGADIIIESQQFSGYFGSLPDGWLIGNGNLVRQVGVDTLLAQIPGFTGSVLLQAQALLQPRAVTGAIKTLVYTNAAILPTTPDWFTDWSKMYAAFDALPEPKQIGLYVPTGNPDLQVPSAGMPVGGWRVKKFVQVGNSPDGNCHLVIQDGAVLHGLVSIDAGILLGSVSTSPVLTWDAGSALLYLGNYASLMPLPGAVGPMIVWGRDFFGGGFPILIITLEEGAFLDNNSGGPGASVLDVTPVGAAFAFAAVNGNGGGGLAINANTLSGTPGAGTSYLVLQDGSGRDFNLSQPSWTGNPLSTSDAFRVSARNRFNIQSAPLASGANYTMDNGSEFIRAAPTGVGGISIVLPNPALHPQEMASFKKVTADIVDAITFTAAGGSTIDGAVSFNVPATPYVGGEFRSDGANWHPFF